MEMAVPLPHNSFYAFYPTLPSELQLNGEEFERIWNLHPAEYGKVNVFGEKNTPRYQQSFGHSYKFSKTEHPAVPLTDPFLCRVMQYCSEHTSTYMQKVPFNGELVNFYVNGNHYIGAHSDSETDLVAGSPIYSFSYGEIRDFIITPNKIKNGDTSDYTQEWKQYKIANKLDEDRIVLSLPNNSLVIMGGDMQKHYKHAVPKRALSSCPNRRINVTVRHFK